MLSYRRHGEPASLWLSDKAVLDGSKPIRGGIPLCWPWFGLPARVGSGKLAHGFARTSLWTLDGVSDHGDGTLVHLSLQATAMPACTLWPHAFELELDVLVGKELSLVLTTRNTGKAPLTYNAAPAPICRSARREAVTLTGLGEPPIWTS